MDHGENPRKGKVCLSLLGNLRIQRLASRETTLAGYQEEALKEPSMSYRAIIRYLFLFSPPWAAW